MSMSSKKKVHSSYYFKKKTLDNILKAKEKFSLKYKNKFNTNKTNYSTLAQDKTTHSQKNIEPNKSLLYFKNSNNAKSKISLKKGGNPPIKLKFFSSSASSNFRKFIDNNNNIFINYKNMSNNSDFLKNVQKMKHSLSHETKIAQKMNMNNSELKRKESSNLNENCDSSNLIRTFNRKSTFKHLNNIIKQYKYKNELKNEEEKISDKVCVLEQNFKVKNFILNPNQVIDYLNLNEKNNFFQPSSTRKSNIKSKKAFNILKYNKIINRNRSALMENRYDKIKKIYPTVLNIEGQRNRKILNEINDEKKKKKKNDKPNCIYYRHHFNLQKRMFREKNKAEEWAKVNLSELAYKSQLLILSMKMYQRAIHQLKKKNSLKFNLDLPLYNLFLNLD